MYLQSAVQAFCTYDCFKRKERQRPREQLSSRQIPQSLRKQVKKRDHNRCKVCHVEDHRRGRLCLHHIVYRSEGGENTLENLITLCHECHLEVHSDKKRYQRLLLKVVDMANHGETIGVLELEAKLG